MSEIEAEARRLNEQVMRMLWRGGYVSEAPVRIHDRGTDSGHGLGGPPLHPRFVAWLRDAGVCFCDETDALGRPRQHVCDKRFGDRQVQFRESRREAHPRRLKRALRQLRLVCPAEFDVVFLMVARGLAWEAAMARINDGRTARGLDPYSKEDFVVLMVSGFSKLVAAW